MKNKLWVVRMTRKEYENKKFKKRDVEYVKTTDNIILAVNSIQDILPALNNTKIGYDIGYIDKHVKYQYNKVIVKWKKHYYTDEIVSLTIQIKAVSEHRLKSLMEATL